MKRYLYSLYFLVALVGLDACKKESDPAPAPVVGKWATDYFLTSGFLAPYTANNNLQLNPLAYGFNDTYEIKSDKTFIYTDRATAVIRPFPGTWDYSGTELTLKYDSGDQEKLTYDEASGKPHLLFTPLFTKQDTLTNPTTMKKEVIKYNMQLTYSKQ